MRKTLLLLMVISTNAFAEVSDKISSIPQMWIQALVIGAIALVISSKWRWFALIGCAVSSFLLFSVYDMQAESYLKRVIIAEQGESYFIHGYLTAFLIAMASILGVIIGYYKRSKKGT